MYYICTLKAAKFAPGLGDDHSVDIQHLNHGYKCASKCLVWSIFFWFLGNKIMAEIDWITLVSQTVTEWGAMNEEPSGIEWRTQHIFPDYNLWPRSLHLWIQGIGCKYFFLLSYSWWTTLQTNNCSTGVLDTLQIGIFIEVFHLLLICFSWSSGSLYLWVLCLHFVLIHLWSVHKPVSFFHAL